MAEFLPGTEVTVEFPDDLGHEDLVRRRDVDERRTFQRCFDVALAVGAFWLGNLKQQDAVSFLEWLGLAISIVAIVAFGYLASRPIKSKAS